MPERANARSGSVPATTGRTIALRNPANRRGRQKAKRVLA